uniref:Chitin-binding type-2 domain-containing protein n=1 Tax=Strigamia maritima TaxID=126957 RepID=T1J0R8_STRMM
MKIGQVIFSAVVLITAVMAFPRIVKRQAGPNSYVLPDGAELIVDNIKSTFSCEGRQYGYYADVDNNCQIFHVCVPVSHADGAQETFIYSFFCGNQTVFDQSQLVCEYIDDAIPCGSTSDWLYLNDFFGNEEKQFYPRKGIPDQQPQGSVASAPDVVRLQGKK